MAIEVFNWGPFHGRHHCAIDPRGTAIIGPTGSGKTTLVDALMTLLALFPKYNLASTGGHESDRDLISYVRGVSGVESAQAENGHVSRPAKTLTGLSAIYSDGNQTAIIGCLLWVDGASNAAEDLKKVWFFAREIKDLLDTLLTLHHEGGKAALTRHARETAGLRLFSSKKEYLAQVRAFFEVGENAFTLLNRAAGLKQINSIDQIFRELVLDDNSSFERASEVAREFDTLHGIYEELQTARDQRDSLLPVRQGKVDWEKAAEKLSARRHLEKLLPRWFAETAVRLWQSEEQKLIVEKDEVAAVLLNTETEARGIEVEVQMLNEEYLRHGGATIQSIEELIQSKERLATEVRKNVNNYQSAVAALGLSASSDESTFHQNRERLPQIKASTEAARVAARQQAVNIASQIKQYHEAEERLAEEIVVVEARSYSNIPASFQTFRELLARELGLQGLDLPFVAEMIEVQANERHWQGAIERAIGSERLRILVPATRVEKALEWVNRRENRLHVRLQGAEKFLPEARFYDDGFARKLSFRDHPLIGQLKLLIERRDRHCVASVEILRRTEYAMTVEGTMSDRDGRFEKQDQKPLAEGWMTGFDNRHLLATLQQQHQQTKVTIVGLEAENTTYSTAETKAAQKLALITQLEALNFAQLDIGGLEKELQQLGERLANLTKPDSDAANAKTRRDLAVERLNETRETISILTRKHGAFENKLETATAELNQARSRGDDGLSEEEIVLIEKEFSLTEVADVHKLGSAERVANSDLQTKIQRAQDQVASSEKFLVRAMGQAKNADTGSLADTGTELRDVDVYLQRLETLINESLPEKLHRFLDYLNQSSGQGVTQLLTSISNDVSLIQERVTDLNATLSRVDFRAGQYLQLHAQIVGHPMLQLMETAQRKLRQIVLSQREDEGEAHYRALGEVVRLLREAAEKRHTLGAQALLDPRHRLQFSVVEVDRATGRNFGARKGSQTGSGGEKEMMASYILTASLSYALCPVGATRPHYASIVLDEAFSKSSPAAAARIIEALRAFGLHPLFVTPNKEIALLKFHTRSAILVHNKNKRASLTSLTWEEIEACAQARKASAQPEPFSS